MMTDDYAGETLLNKIMDSGKLSIVKGLDAKGEYIAWCPFHPDGEGKPPHNANLHFSERGFKCFACGESGGLRKLAEKLGIPVEEYQNHDGKIIDTYDYRDANNNLLYQVIRKAGKKFLQRRPDNNGWTWNLNGTERVPYRLPELLASRGDTVYIVEGEKDTDRLRQEGITATTNSGGAGKWPKEFAKYLEGRDVVIIPDNDEPGRKHANDIASSLSGKAKSLKVVPLPDVPEKGDVSDYLNSGNTIDDLHKLVDATKELSATPNDDEPTSKKKKSEAAKLLSFVLDSGIELFHDERLEAYARIKTAKGLEISRIGLAKFIAWLSRLAWEKMGKPICRDTETGVCSVLAAKAIYDGEEYRLETRYSRRGNEIWIDMDGKRAIKVIPGSWEIVDSPPILFRTFDHQKALPEPIKGGDAHKVFDLVNLKDDDAMILYLSFLVAAMVPDIPIALLLVHGVQGSAKTTLLKITKELTDPSIIQVRGGIVDAKEFAIEAFKNRTLFFDNLTSLSDGLSDCFCRTISGEGFSARVLFTDEDSKVFRYQRVIGLAGINPVANRPDLLDRSLLIEMEPIPPDNRITESVLWQRFNEIKPAIFGGLLDALARAMALQPTLEIKRLPRMADFARWGAAAAMALGYTMEQFLSAYSRNVGKQNEAAIDESLVAQAIQEFMKDKAEWEGTPSELLEKVNMLEHINTNAKSWPKSSSWLSKKLKEVEQNLMATEITIIHKRDGKHRILTITKMEDSPVIAVTNEPSERYKQEVTVEKELASFTVTTITGNDGISGTNDGDMTPPKNEIIRVNDSNDANDSKSEVIVEDLF